jgi:hypothetical protein
MLGFEGVPSDTRITSRSLRSLFALEGATRIVLETSKELNGHEPSPDIRMIPAISPHCVFQAALMHINLADETIDKMQWLDDLKAFKDTLDYFNTRWKVAGMVCSLIVS